MKGHVSNLVLGMNPFIHISFMLERSKKKNASIALRCTTFLANDKKFSKEWICLIFFLLLSAFFWALHMRLVQKPNLVSSSC